MTVPRHAAPPDPTQAEAAADPAAAELFAGAGEMRALARTFDWAGTALGPVSGWPQSLRTAVGIVMGSAFANIVCWGPDLVQVYNDGYIPITGAKHPWALGRPTAEVWPEVWHLNAPLFARAQAGETVHVVEAPYALRRRGPDQPPDDTWFTLSFNPVPDEHGAAGGVLVTAFEITDQVATRRLQDDRERLLAALEVERSRLEEVFRRSPSFVVAYRGPEHRYEFVNQAYYGLVGHRPLLGRPLDEAIPEAREQGFTGLLDRVLATGEPWVGRETSVWLERTAGAPRELRYVDMVFQPLTEADGTRSGVVAHGNDVTEQVLARREVERLLAESERARADAESARVEAEAANRAKSDFLATMSHELRTPLNAIGGYAELIEMGIRGPTTAEQQADLERIQRSQRHLLGLINGVLNYARLEAGAVHYDLEDVRLDEVLATCEALVAPQVRGKGLVLDYDGSAAGVAVRADREKVRQVVLNLLTNAVKFTEPGGRVDVTCADADGVVRVRVRDTGRGIAAEQLERVFQPFVQVDAALTRTQEGVGLGLAISRDLARGMGGDITAESALGAGSTFTLTLRRA